MGDVEGLAAYAFEQIALQGFTRGKGDRVNEPVEPVPLPAQGHKQCRDLLVTRHVTGQDGRAAKLSGKLLDPPAQILVLIGKGELGAFPRKRLRDPIGDRAARQKSGHQDLFVLQKSHCISFLWKRVPAAQSGCGTRSKSRGDECEKL